MLWLFSHITHWFCWRWVQIKKWKIKSKDCALCVCTRVRAYTLQGVLQAAAVCSNRKCAVSLNLLPRWSWFTEIRPVTLLLNQSDICWMFFLLLFFFPLHRHTWFLKDAPSQALIHIHTINSSQWVTLCSNVHQHTHPEWEWLIALVVAHPVQF